MILDTNALSAAADDDPAIRQRLETTKQLSLPVVVLGEYRYGIAQSWRQDHYARWLEALIEDSTILEITEPTTRYYAQIWIELRKAGTPIPTNDLWIAALCRQHEQPLLSRDRHFDAVRGIQRLDW